MVSPLWVGVSSHLLWVMLELRLFGIILPWHRLYIYFSIIMKNMNFFFFVSGPELQNGCTFVHKNLWWNMLNTQNVPFWGLKALSWTENVKNWKKKIYKNSINSNATSFGQFHSYFCKNFVGICLNSCIFTSYTS